jgi:hypothetical protein
MDVGIVRDRYLDTCEGHMYGTIEHDFVVATA